MSQTDEKDIAIPDTDWQEELPANESADSLDAEPEAEVAQPFI